MWKIFEKLLGIPSETSPATEPFRWKNRAELELRVREIVAEHKGIPLSEVTLETKLDDC